jgi:DNA (cytosine-5)-methyltransferase 1
MKSRMNRPTIISLYTGAGGMDYGFEAAGFDTRVAVEFNHDCCVTLQNNRDWEVIERSIFQTPTAAILKRGGLSKGKVDLLIGGPPCQPFSKSGYWSKGDSLRLKDSRADTLTAYMRVLEEALPRTFVLENVEGLAFAGKDEGFRLILSRVEAINRRTGSRYRVAYKVLNAAEYGVPQLRSRFLIVGARNGREFVFPNPTHGPSDSPTVSARALEPYRTAWDAIADVKPEPDENLHPRGKWADLLRSIPEGKNYLWHTSRGGGLPLFGWRTRYWTFLLKLAKSQPSWTIQAQPGPSVGPFHWDSRRLSARELCRLQTFPEDVNIHGGRGAMQRQVGNAVPSLLTEVLGRAVMEQLLGYAPARCPLKLMPPQRAKLPPPSRVQPVAAAFKALEGVHEAHPGTGRGKGAQRQALVAA